VLTASNSQFEEKLAGKRRAGKEAAAPALPVRWFAPQKEP
jgi:hypothetical protein